MRQFIIGENDSDQRLDKFITKAVPLLPKNLLYKYIRTKRIKLNGKRAQLNDRLKTGDQVALYINDEFFNQQSNLEFLCAPSLIQIVYEDENILLLNKPQGLVVHEDNENTVDTLINRVKHYLYDKKEYDPDSEQSFAPALANRIDRNTCGIVIVAKNAAALRVLNEKIKHREIQKQYLCLVVGTPPKQQDTLIHYLKKDSSNNQVTIYDKPLKDTKTIITQYTVLQSKGNLSLVKVNLKTGRTHQIRAHMAYIKTPILGDGKYGNGAINKKYGMKQQALCSYRIGFCFQSDAGILNYLSGKYFEITDIWFVKQFQKGDFTV
jgi:23S rRNA pseudouridine955/2504/2580 synthase